jgi:hypothetical protein
VADGTESFTPHVIAQRAFQSYSRSMTRLKEEDVMENLRSAQPGRHWSVDAFKAFWSNPDASKVSGVLTEDVVGHWPRPIGVVHGASDYTQVIETMMKVCPDFRLKVPEYALSGDYAFVRWIATGTGPAGRFEFTGCDRVRTRNGHVCENYIFCDDPFFAQVAAELRKQA